MGLLDYYRQFEDVDQEEVNRLARARREEERQLALQQVPELDLSSTEWPELPDSEVVNASIFAARGRVNGYPDRHAEAIRRALAERHEVTPERIVFGNGAAELLQATALMTMSPGDELLTPWPSYPLYPLMAARAAGSPVPVEGADSALDRLGEAVTEKTRLVVICNPNDPTGAFHPAEAIATLAAGLPERTLLVVDEALAHFGDAEHLDSVLRLTDTLPRMLVIRTFSKIYGLSGLRAGYAVGSAGSAKLLDAIAPVLGVNALTQAAVDQALAIGGPEIERRRASVSRERARLIESLGDLPVEAAPTQANFVWFRAEGMSGAALTASLRREGVIVAAGAPLGAEDHVRASIRHAAATERLLAALGKVLRPPRTA
jgi:histidinol-phosphate aminotransferase